MSCPSPFQAGQTLCLRCWGGLPHPQACVTPLPPRSSSRDPGPAISGAGSGRRQACPQGFPGPRCLPSQGQGVDKTPARSSSQRLGRMCPLILERRPPHAHGTGDTPSWNTVPSRGPGTVRSAWGKRAQRASCRFRSVPQPRHVTTSPGGPSVFHIRVKDVGLRSGQGPEDALVRAGHCQATVSGHLASVTRGAEAVKAVTPR